MASLDAAFAAIPEPEEMSLGQPIEDKTSRLCQFSKTKMCKFFVLGKCTKGTQCPFAHDSDEIRRLPDLRCTKLCKMLIQTGQCTNPSCSYAHSKEELRSTGAFHKTKLCRFMQTGHCTLGAKCNFAHSAIELREAETVADMLTPPGLGWESMIGDLLDDEDNSEAFPGQSSSTKKTQDLQPAYVRVKPLHEAWPFGAAGISEESTACDDSLGGLKDEAYWDYQTSQLATGALSFPLGDLSSFAADGSNLAYSGGCSDWANPWVAQQRQQQYAGSLFAGAFDPWDWRAFGDNVEIDQKVDWKVKKSGKTDKAAPKMRAVRTSESTLCTLGDTSQA